MAAEPTTVEDQATVRGVSVEDGKSLDRQAARQGSISLETRRTDVAGSSTSPSHQQTQTRERVCFI